MHINSISCGQGAPSLFLIVMAGEGMFPADVVIVADTGWENDMLWSTGERSTAKTFFEQVTKPLASRYGIDAVMVRTIDENGDEYLPIPDSILVKQRKAGTVKESGDGNWSDFYGLDIPLFGSKGGRLMQSCTGKWKIQAIRQELRRRHAVTATTAIGLHRNEIHRVKPNESTDWQQLWWPLLDLSNKGSMGIGRTWDRTSIQSEMNKRGLPYLVTTECDGCPHKDWRRWQRTSPTTIDDLAKFESTFGGEFFLTKYRMPLKEALAIMEQSKTGEPSLFDVCDSGYCFV